MATCAKVKNPCKICLAPVTQKNGLQCQGVCASWVHFNCIDYTPGKVKDIKAGLLTITCPCPDCKTTIDKEFYTNRNEGYTCEKLSCPAKFPPVCGNTQCIANIQSAGCSAKSSLSSMEPSMEATMDNTVGDSANAKSIGSEIDQVCFTVGQLTEQLTSLMIKLKDAVNTHNLGGGSQKCNQDCTFKEGARPLCPKPCFCAENNQCPVSGKPCKGKKKK